VLCHNHPGGNLAPSPDNLIATEKIQKGLEAVDIRLLDHIIITGNKALSFLNKGLLPLSNCKDSVVTSFLKALSEINESAVEPLDEVNAKHVNT
jgi:hypothetical protein